MSSHWLIPTACETHFCGGSYYLPKTHTGPAIIAPYTPMLLRVSMLNGMAWIGPVLMANPWDPTVYEATLTGLIH